MGRSKNKCSDINNTGRHVIWKTWSYIGSGSGVNRKQAVRVVDALVIELQKEKGK